MKTNFTFIVLSSLILFSCASRNSQNNIDSLFKRWKIDYVEMNEQKLNEIGSEGELDYEFKKDNTYSVFSMNKVITEGKWEWNKDEKCIYFRNEYDEIEGKVISIQKDKITLVPTSVVGNNPALENVKFYYIPKQK